MDVFPRTTTLIFTTNNNDQTNRVTVVENKAPYKDELQWFMFGQCCREASKHLTRRSRIKENKVKQTGEERDKHTKQTVGIKRR